MEALSDRVVGLEVTHSSVKAALVTIDGGTPALEWAREIAIVPTEDDVNPLYIACGKALQGVKNELVVSSTEGADVLVRQLHLDVTRDADIEAVIDFQIEPLLPFPIEEAVVDHVVLERDKKEARIAVLTVQKARLAAHLERLKAAGVEPERTSCIPMALSTLLYRLIPSEEAQGMIHLGAEATTCVVVRRGKVLATRTISLGITHLKIGKGTDLTNFDAALHPKLNKRLEHLRSEVIKTFFALTSKRGQAATIAQIFTTGDFDQARNLDAYLAQGLDRPLSDMPRKSPFCATLGDVTKFAIPLGLALGAMPLEVPRIDFRKAEFAYPKPWRRWQKRLVTYFGVCILLSGAVFGFGKAIRLQKEQILAEEYQVLAQLASETSSQIAAADMVDASRQMRMKFNATPETYALAPSVPRVGELLAWLGSHPNVVDDGKSLIQLESLQYSLCKYPTPKNPRDRYQVRVDLEFSAQSPTAARELHEALREPNPYIDPKTEIKWAASRGKYRASFFLKDHTHYPEVGR